MTLTSSRNMIVFLFCFVILRPVPLSWSGTLVRKFSRVRISSCRCREPIRLQLLNIVKLFAAKEKCTRYITGTDLYPEGVAVSNVSGCTNGRFGTWARREPIRLHRQRFWSLWPEECTKDLRVSVCSDLKFHSIRYSYSCSVPDWCVAGFETPPISVWITINKSQLRIIKIHDDSIDSVVAGQGLSVFLLRNLIAHYTLHTTHTSTSSRSRRGRVESRLSISSCVTISPRLHICLCIIHACATGLWNTSFVFEFRFFFFFLLKVVQRSLQKTEQWSSCIFLYRCCYDIIMLLSI